MPLSKKTLDFLLNLWQNSATCIQKERKNDYDKKVYDYR